MPTTADQPGWRPDPERPGQLRWWNGLGWSDARRAADGAAGRVRDAAAEAARSSTLTPQEVARTTADRTGARAVPAGAAASANSSASAALPLGIIALVFGGFGVVSAAVAVAGLVASLTGLLRSRRLSGRGGRSGVGRSLAGLVLSLIALARFLPQLVAALPDGLTDLLNS